MLTVYGNTIILELSRRTGKDIKFILPSYLLAPRLCKFVTELTLPVLPEYQKYLSHNKPCRALRRLLFLGYQILQAS